MKNDSFYFKIFWIFVIGGFLGFIIETLYCFFRFGYFINRSSVIYGPFSIVWGVGCILMSYYAHFLNRYTSLIKNRKYFLIAILGGLLGSLHEFLTSLFSELFIGVIHWNYSDMPFNLHGRINLLFSIYWCFLSLIWVIFIWPKLNKTFEKIPWHILKTFSFIMAIALILDIYISTSALLRYSKRNEGYPAKTSYSEFLDTHYPDIVIDYCYPGIEIIHIN